MNNIYVVSCPRSGSWNSLYDTLDNVSKSNILDFSIHVWAGRELQDNSPKYSGNATVHENIDPLKQKKYI